MSLYFKKNKNSLRINKISIVFILFILTYVQISMLERNKNNNNNQSQNIIEHDIKGSWIKIYPRSELSQILKLKNNGLIESINIPKISYTNWKVENKFLILKDSNNKVEKYKIISYSKNKLDLTKKKGERITYQKVK